MADDMAVVLTAHAARMLSPGVPDEHRALAAELAALRDEVSTLMLVADGVVHDPRCDHATPPLCLRCRMEALVALLHRARVYTPRNLRWDINAALGIERDPAFIGRRKGAGRG